ncbi:MAG: glycosyltransferase family 4 protein [Anaerolineae bacterium]|nr:glycosyltransferase family 4 protein [Anaerolineae bacterium]
MRILILSDRIPPEHKGGAEVVAWNLAKALKRAGHDVHVIAATAGRAFEEAREGIPTYHVHSHYPARLHAFLSLYNPQTAGPLRRLYRRIAPDVLNAHNVHHDLSYYSLTLAHRTGIRTVFSAHDAMPFAYGKLTHFVDPAKGGADSPAAYRLPRGYNLRQMRLRYNPLRNAAIRRILAHCADARTAPSDALRQALEANDLPPFTVVPNGIDPAAFDPPQAAVDALRARLDLEGRKIILFAGRLTRAKGVEQILSALSVLVERVPEALLLALSARPIDEMVNQPAFEHLKAQHIRSAGWLSGDELAAAYRLARVVVTPSIYLDPFPTVNLEAMASGTPVLATCYGGSREAVRDGATGYIVNPFKTEAFAAKLAALLCNDALREQMGRAGRAHVIANFSLERQAQEMEAVYFHHRDTESTEKR